MKYIKDGDKYLIRIFKDEELFSELESFATQEGLKTGMLKGVGALKDVTLGYYELEKKTYKKAEFKGDYELLSLDGNLSLVDGKPFFHIHTVLGDQDFSCKGGHLFSAKVAVTTELYFLPFGIAVEREYEEEIGLKLLNLCPISE